MRLAHISARYYCQTPFRSHGRHRKIWCPKTLLMSKFVVVSGFRHTHSPADQLSLRRITSGSHVPSWSWVAYMDGTEYLHPQFGEYDWEEPNSRWSDRDDATAVSDLHRILVATVRRFDLIAAMKVKSDVILGDPGRFRQTRPT